jgi:UDP-glucose 4-epimerase
MNKKILVTGAAGFIGSNFVKWLLANTDHDVIGMDNLSTGKRDNLPQESERFTYFVDSILDPLALNCIFQEFTPDVVYNFAAYAAEGRSNSIRSFIHQNNTVGTANVINMCVKYKCKLVFTSSVAVYSGIPPFNEETVPNPIDEYGLSKWTSEKSIEIAGKEQGLDWCIVRPRNVYGPSQSIDDPSRNVFGIWMRQALENKPMTIYGDGSNTREFTYIDEIMSPLYVARNVKHEIVNLGSNKTYTILDANKILQKITGYNQMLNLEKRMEVEHAYCEVEKSVRLLSYYPSVDLEEGLKRMWESIKDKPVGPIVMPPELEVNVNLHSSIK